MFKLKKFIQSNNIAEISPNLGKEMNIQVHKAFRTPRGYNQKRTSPHHIRVKMQEYGTRKEYWKQQDRGVGTQIIGLEQKTQK
jgi:hypothetical protein